MNFKKYHVSRNLCPITSFDKTTDVYYTILFNTPIPTGTYTLGAKITSTSAESRISFRKADMSQIIASNIVIQTGRSQLTVTLNEPCYGIYIYGGTTVIDNIPIKYESIMFNTGSTPLPYEPYSSEVWHDTPHYIHNTSTDTITTLPADIYPNAATATVGLKGQAVQSGTPTPDNPIMPNGTGERTGNLLYSSKSQTVGSVLSVEQVEGVASFILSKSVSQTDTSTTVPVDITLEAGSYTLSVMGFNLFDASYDRIFIRNDGGTIVAQNCQTNRPITFTLTEATHINRLTFVADSLSTYSNSEVKIMLNSGSTALPYEPHGFEISISSAGQTTPVYLGETQSIRRIKKLVLTGEEEWQFFSDGIGSWQFYINNISLGGVAQSSCVSNIAPYGVTATTRQRYDYGCYLVTSGSGIAFQMKGAKDTFTGITAWKSYLAAQYAAGTPVCVWYVLATEETSVVNEPLMRIGDYADTLSNVSIPVTAGGDTLSVGTTVQPSEVTVNYKGWHPVADVHERDNGAWT